MKGNKRAMEIVFLWDEFSEIHSNFTLSWYLNFSGSIKH